MMTERELSSLKSKFLRDYCKDEYQNLYKKQSDLEKARSDLRFEERLYENQVYLDSILGDKGSEKYKVPESEYKKVELAQKAVVEADLALKERKKNGRKTREYQTIGYIFKPSNLPKRDLGLWYSESLDGISYFTYEKMKSSLKELKERYGDGFYYLLLQDKKWSVFRDGVFVCFMSSNDCPVSCDFRRSSQRELCSPVAVIVYPGIFFSDYPSYYVNSGVFDAAIRSIRRKML